jgi:hypothetical protein
MIARLLFFLLAVAPAVLAPAVLAPAVLAQDAPSVRFAPFDPEGACGEPYLVLNTNTGTASSCVNGAWMPGTIGNGVPLAAQLPDTCTPDAIPALVVLLNPPGIYACTAQDTWTPVGPAGYRADNYASLAGALAAAGDNAEIILPENYTATLPSQLAITHSGVTLRCANGAGIAKGFSGDAIRISGRNVVIDGCRIDGAKGRYAGGLIVVNGANGVLIRNSTLTNGAGTGLGIFGSTRVTVTGSTLTQNLGSPIYAQDGLDQIEIGFNSIDSSTASPPNGIDTIGVHTYANGGTATNISIHDNTIVHGGDNFAIEVGSFGPNSQLPANVVVGNNWINLVRDSNGGVSYSTLMQGSVLGNRIDAGGRAVRINGIELVSTTDVVVADNILTNTPAATTYTISINGGSRNIVENNVFEGGIYVGTSRVGAPSVNDNVIQQNILTVPPGAAMPRGVIWFQCNTFTGSVSRNVVRHNVIYGNSSGAGVYLENDFWANGGKVDSNDAGANQISGATDAVHIGPHVTNTVVDGGG